ncbi:MAG: flotillin domain-containing protein [Oricola sp.]
MYWTVLVLTLIVLVVIGIVILNRFYAKSTRDTALIRTGMGGGKIVIDGGALALPFLHKIDRMNMRSMRLSVDRSGNSSLITVDRLRVDIAVEFHIRVAPTAEGIATAAQAYGSKAFREDEMQTLLSGKLIDAVQGEASTRTMDMLHEDRSGFVAAVAARLAANLASSGLIVESVSLVRLDQTPFSSLDDTNAFNAVGMRRLAELISENRKARITVEADTDIAIRKRQLEQVKERLSIEREQEETEIAKRLDIEQQRIRADTEIETARTRSGTLSEEARIERDRGIKQAEIERDLHLRKREMEAITEVEQRKIDNAILIAHKRAEETIEQAKTETARLKIIEAQEAVQTSKDLAVAERARKLALLRAEEEAEVDDTKVRSQVSSILALAKAEGEATEVKGSAERDRLVAEAEGKRAQIEAENQQSEALLRSRIEMHKLDRMPEIMTQMMKPVEKIESIRINQIAGLGNNGGGSGGDASPFNQALESILGMSVQLPMMKKIGDEIGLDFDAQLAGRTADAAGRAASATRPKKDN